MASTAGARPKYSPFLKPRAAKKRPAAKRKPNKATPRAGNISVLDEVSVKKRNQSKRAERIADSTNSRAATMVLRFAALAESCDMKKRLALLP